MRETADSRKGIFVLLPSLAFDEEDFTTADGESWNKKGMAFGQKLISALVEIDKAFTSEKQKSPAPAWVNNAKFQSKQESALEKQIDKLDLEIESLQKQKQNLKLIQNGI